MDRGLINGDTLVDTYKVEGLEELIFLETGQGDRLFTDMTDIWHAVLDPDTQELVREDCTKIENTQSIQCDLDSAASAEGALRLFHQLADVKGIERFVDIPSYQSKTLIGSEAVLFKHQLKRYVEEMEKDGLSSISLSDFKNSNKDYLPTDATFEPFGRDRGMTFGVYINNIENLSSNTDMFEYKVFNSDTIDVFVSHLKRFAKRIPTEDYVNGDFQDIVRKVKGTRMLRAVKNGKKAGKFLGDHGIDNNIISLYGHRRGKGNRQLDLQYNDSQGRQVDVNIEIGGEFPIEGEKQPKRYTLDELRKKTDIFNESIDRRYWQIRNEVFGEAQPDEPKADDSKFYAEPEMPEAPEKDRSQEPKPPGRFHRMKKSIYSSITGFGKALGGIFTRDSPDNIHAEYVERTDAQLHRYKKELKAKEAVITDHKSTVDKQRMTIDDLEQKVGGLSKSNAQSKQDLTDVKKKNSKLNEELKSYEDKAGLSNQYKEELKDKEAEIADYKSTVEAQSKTIGNLEEMVGRLNMSNAQYKQDLENSQERLSKLDEELKSYEEKLKLFNQYEQELKVKLDDIADKESTVEEQSRTIDNLEERIEDYTKSNAQLKQDLTDAYERLSELKDELKSYEDVKIDDVINKTDEMQDTGSAEIDKMTSLYNSGMTYNQVAKETGLSKDDVSATIAAEYAQGTSMRYSSDRATPEMGERISKAYNDFDRKMTIKDLKKRFAEEFNLLNRKGETDMSNYAFYKMKDEFEMKNYGVIARRASRIVKNVHI